MTSKNKVLFNLSFPIQSKIKHAALHAKKQWVAVINQTNSFSLWNLKEKILIKSFNCNTLDDAKNIQIRQIVFYDRHSLPGFKSDSSMRNQIIFVTPFKIYLYDYITDGIKMISEKEMEQKNIRKVCVYSENKLCISLNDGSFKVLDNKDFYTKNSMSIKTVRGYHTKPISWMIAYCQNENENPRMVTVSVDGLMACWNLDTILHSNNSAEVASPSFKFMMAKSGKNDSNNGEEVISLQYDSSSYRLITLTQSYITIWSTMTGMELKRFKNQHKFKELAFFNHFSFGSNCFLAHSNRAELVVLKQHSNECEIDDQIDWKNFIQNGDNNIMMMKCLPYMPSEVLILTSTSLLVLEINKFYRPSFGVHHSFQTSFSTLNSKEFIIKAEGSIRTDIHPRALQNINFQEDILFNFFYLSYDLGILYFNLIEIQFENMLHQQRKYKISKIQENSPLQKSHGSQSIIEVSFDGKQFFVFNKQLSYYEIFSSSLLKNNEESLLQLEEVDQEHIDFYSKLSLISRGVCRDIVWHQYKNQFAAFKAFDKNGKIVEYVVQSEKKGIFSKSEKDKKLKFTSQIASWCVCIYEKNTKMNQYQFIYCTKPISTKLFRIYSLGFTFGYSIEKNGNEHLEYINDEKTSNKEIEGSPSWPEQVYTSFCQSFQIYSYDGYFIVYRVQENGCLNYFRTIPQTILEGIFWEKIFFFATKNQIYFLQILDADVVMIKLADAISQSELQMDKSLLNKALNDDLGEWCSKMPEGQLQLIGVVNLNLMVLNYLGNCIFIPLRPFPYIQFCVEVIGGYAEKLSSIYKASSPHLQQLMKQTLDQYGQVMHDLG